MICPYCSCERMEKVGVLRSRSHFRCCDCGRWVEVEKKKERNEK